MSEWMNKWDKAEIRLIIRRMMIGMMIVKIEAISCEYASITWKSLDQSVITSKCCSEGVTDKKWHFIYTPAFLKYKLVYIFILKWVELTIFLDILRH